MSVPRLALAYRLGFEAGRQHAKVVHTEDYHSYEYVDLRETWEMSIAGLPGCAVQCFLPRFPSVHHARTFPSGPVYHPEDFLRGVEASQALCVMAAQSCSYLDLEGLPNTVEPPFFLASEPLGDPCVIRARLTLTVGSLFEFPDVRATILYERRKAEAYPIRFLETIDSEMAHTARATQLPLGCLLPMHLETGKKRVHGAFRLDQSVGGGVFLAKLLLSDDVTDISAGTRVARTVRVPKSKSAETICAEIAVVEDISSIDALHAASWPSGPSYKT
jgi:hypothetical protein